MYGAEEIDWGMFSAAVCALFLIVVICAAKAGGANYRKDE